MDPATLREYFWHLEARILGKGEWRSYGVNEQGQFGFHGVAQPRRMTFDEAAALLRSLRKLMPASQLRIVSIDTEPMWADDLSVTGIYLLAKNLQNTAYLAPPEPDPDPDPGKPPRD